MQFRRKQPPVSQWEISELIGAIATLQRSRDKAKLDNPEEYTIINSNIMSANRYLAYLLEQAADGKGQ